MPKGNKTMNFTGWIFFFLLSLLLYLNLFYKEVLQ